jgi:hypothetical protein
MESVVKHPNTMSPKYVFTQAAAMAKNLPPSVQPEPQAALSVSTGLNPNSII